MVARALPSKSIAPPTGQLTTLTCPHRSSIRFSKLGAEKRRTMTTKSVRGLEGHSAGCSIFLEVVGAEPSSNTDDLGSCVDEIVNCQGTDDDVQEIEQVEQLRDRGFIKESSSWRECAPRLNASQCCPNWDALSALGMGLPRRYFHRFKSSMLYVNHIESSYPELRAQ